MSVDYNFSALVGWRVKTKDILEPFKKETPEISHMEDRYNEKTGKKIHPVKIIDQFRETFYEFNGEKYEDAQELYADPKIQSEKVHFEIQELMGNEEWTIISLNLDQIGHRRDDGSISVSKDLLLPSNVFDIQAKVVKEVKTILGIDLTDLPIRVMSVFEFC